MKFIMCLAALIGIVGFSQLPAEASCIGPILSLYSSSAIPGGTVRAAGQLFKDGCHDVIVNGYVAPTLPAKNVRFFLVQGSRIEQIGTADADKDFTISVILTIPANTPIGEATIFAEIPGYVRTRAIAFSVVAKAP